MTRLRFAPACLAIVLFAFRTPAADAPKPNIVFLLSDDQGYADVGWHGSEIKTQNLDKIAAVPRPGPAL